MTNRPFQQETNYAELIDRIKASFSSDQNKNYHLEPSQGHSEHKLVVVY